MSAFAFYVHATTYAKHEVGSLFWAGTEIKDKVTGKGGAYFYEVTHKSHPPGSNSFVLHTKSTKVHKKS